MRKHRRFSISVTCHGKAGPEKWKNSAAWITAGRVEDVWPMDQPERVSYL